MSMIRLFSINAKFMFIRSIMMVGMNLGFH